MISSVAGILLHPVTYSSATEKVISWAIRGECHYVCVANVHMVMEANDSSEFMQLVNQADLTVPDGMPLVWVMRLKGYRTQPRVYGPILMLHILETAAQAGVPVGFYGGEPETLRLLTEKLHGHYPALEIAFAHSPPFSTMDSEEDDSIVRQLNRSGARILFVGLGCPKQEIWMAEHRGRLNTVMLGVGAAFDFNAGVKRQAPVWMQNFGLEWLFRLLTEPRRLWRRYLYHNPRFVVLAVADILGWLKRND